MVALLKTPSSAEFGGAPMGASTIAFSIAPRPEGVAFAGQVSLFVAVKNPPPAAELRVDLRALAAPKRQTAVRLILQLG